MHPFYLDLVDGHRRELERRARAGRLAARRPRPRFGIRRVTNAVPVTIDVRAA